MQKKLKFQLRSAGGKNSIIHYRPILEKLKDDVEKGVIKHLWVYDKSRLFRNLNDSLFFRKDFLDKFKVSFYEGVVGNKVNFDSIKKKLAYNLISQWKESYRD